jgi:hypothetical protein
MPGIARAFFVSAEAVDFLAISLNLSLLAATWEPESAIAGDIFYRGNACTISAFVTKDGQRWDLGAGNALS